MNTTIRGCVSGVALLVMVGVGCKKANDSGADPAKPFVFASEAGGSIPLGVDSETELAQSGVFTPYWTNEGIGLEFKIYDSDIFISDKEQTLSSGDLVRIFLDLRKPDQIGRYPYETGVWNLELNPVVQTSRPKILSLGLGSIMDEAGLASIEASSYVSIGEWGVSTYLPWKQLGYVPEFATQIGFGYSVLDRRNDSPEPQESLGLKELDAYNRPETDPILFDKIIFSEFRPNIAGMSFVAEETVLNGETCTHLRVVREASDKRYRDTKIKIDGLPHITLLPMRPSSGGRFTVSEIYLPVDKAKTDIRKIVFSGMDDAWTYSVDVNYPISRARQTIEASLPASELENIVDKQRRLLATYLKEMATEVTERLSLEPTAYRIRQKQLRGWNNPSFYDKEIAFFIRWSRCILDAKEPAGMLERYHVWQSSLDDSLQLLRIELPVGFKPEEPCPVALDFHGDYGDNTRHGQMLEALLREESGRVPRYKGEYARIYLCGRGNQAQRLGDEEFKIASELAQRLFKPSAGRFLLQGGSRGASDALAFAFRYPGKVANIDLRSGYYISDLLPKTQMLAAERNLLNTLHGFPDQVDKLHHTGGRIMAGSQDRGSVGATLKLGELLKTSGSKIESLIVDKGSHSTVCDLETLSVKSDPGTRPNEIFLCNGSLTYANADGLVVQGMKNFGDEWSIHLRLLSNRRQIEVETRNVSRFILVPSMTGLFSPLTESLSIDGGKFLKPDFTSRNQLKFQFTEGRWEMVNSFDNGPSKQPDLFGPVVDIRRRKFIIVLGTTEPDSAQAIRARGYKIARELAGLDSGSGCKLTIKTDQEISDDELRTSSLWLVGGPAENDAYSRLGYVAPFSITETKLRLNEATYEDGAAFFLNMIRPHPTAKAQYLYMEAATRPAGYFAPVMPSFQFDYSVTKMDLIRNPLLVRGFFNEMWNYEQKLEFVHE